MVKALCKGYHEFLGNLLDGLPLSHVPAENKRNYVVSLGGGNRRNKSGYVEILDVLDIKIGTEIRIV